MYKRGSTGSYSDTHYLEKRYVTARLQL